TATVDQLLVEISSHIKGNADLTRQAIDGWTRILHFGDRYGTAYARKVGSEFLERIKKEQAGKTNDECRMGVDERMAEMQRGERRVVAGRPAASRSPFVLRPSSCVLGSLLVFGLTTVQAGETLAFRTTILPILTKAGCNAGACHGAATGQGGFKLSLLGYDPRADHDSIVREFEGRRVNLAAPEESLILRKPAMQMAHGGGQRFTVGSQPDRLLP